MSKLIEYLETAAQAERVLENYNKLADAANSAKELYTTLYDECAVKVKELSDAELALMNSEWAKEVICENDCATLARCIEELNESNHQVIIYDAGDRWVLQTESFCTLKYSEIVSDLIALCEEMKWSYTIKNP